MKKLFAILLLLFIGSSMKAQTQASALVVPNDPLMNYALKLQSENVPVPNVFLGKLLTDVKQPTLNQGYAPQRSTLASLGALAFLVGLIAALADPANAEQWWTICLIGLLVYLFIP